MKTAVILDCDNTAGLPDYEIDDALALLSLVVDPAVELLGVTTTFGNGTIDEVQAQTQWFLDTIGRRDVPVLRGAGHPGDFDTEAVEFMVRSCRERPGEVHVVAIGPVGNVAAAGAADSEFYQSVAGVYAMGGYTAPLRFPKREVCELNLSSDPEAAFSLLTSPAPVHLMSAQICLGLPFRRADFALIAQTPGWFRDVVSEWFFAFSAATGVDAFYLWDLLPLSRLRDDRRLDDRLVEIKSTVEDLETGTLRLTPADSNDLRTPGVVNVPEHFRDDDGLRRELAARWSRGLVQGERQT